MRKLSKKAVLFGAGSSIIVDIEETCLRCKIEVVAIVSNYNCKSHAIHSEKIIALENYDPEFKKYSFVFPLFTPGHRKYAHEQAKALGARRFDPIVDPTAITPISLDISEGVFINSGAILGGKSCLCAFCFINRGASLGHHISVGEFASIGPSAVMGAHVMIGRGAVIGAGAIILPKVIIGNNSVVGAGSVVTDNVPEHVLVIGNPARIIRKDIRGYNGVGV